MYKEIDVFRVICFIGIGAWYLLAVSILVAIGWLATAVGDAIEAVLVRLPLVD